MLYSNYFCSNQIYEYDLASDTEEPAELNYEKAIGLDYKSDGFYCDSNGNVEGMPKYFRKSEKKLGKLQQRLSRKKGAKKGKDTSNNFVKQQQKVNKLHRHIANQRLDHHKLSTEIANQYDIVCIEDLDMKAISNKKGYLSKSTMDNACGLFTILLDYKMKDRAKTLVKVDRFYPSSQLCSRCGHKQKLELSERTYACPHCGMVMDRDHNAAVNILNEGLNVFRSEKIDQTCTTAETVGSNVCGDDVRHQPVKSPLFAEEAKSSGSRKLEVSYPE